MPHFCILQHILQYFSYFNSIFLCVTLQCKINLMYILLLILKLWCPYTMPYFVLQCSLKLCLSKSDFVLKTTHQKGPIIEKFLLCSKMSLFVFSSTLQNTFLTYTQFCTSHFAIYSKLQHTIYYLHWNFDTDIPTPYLTFYFFSSLNKMTICSTKISP